MNEFDIIERFFRPLSNEQNSLGLLDDAALVCPAKGHEFVVTSDAIVAGVHFFAEDSPQDIAIKAIGVNASDLIAKGAMPKFYLLTLAYPPTLSTDWIEKFTQALQQQQNYYGCVLLGGDSVKTPNTLTISITMMGEVPIGQMVRRSTAQKGDGIYVSGTIGDSVIGLALRSSGQSESLTSLTVEAEAYFNKRYCAPQPDIKLCSVVRSYAHAAMDISDGLIGDLEKLCQASGVGAQLDLFAVPIQASLRELITKDFDLLKSLLTGGDDYEVLLTLAPEKAAEAQKAAQAKKLCLTKIGNITDSTTGYRYYDKAGSLVVFDRKSYRHF